MNKILIVYTSWYEDYIKSMTNTASVILSPDNAIELSCAPGAIELASLAKYKIIQSKEEFAGILFLGIVIRGETTHYELVTNEAFRSIGNLSMEYPNIAFINNIICVENKDQLLKRIESNTKSNANALIALIDEKSS